VIIKRSKPDEIKNGIYIPDVAKRKTVDGEVVGVGKNTTGDVKLGDRVLIGNLFGMNKEIEMDGGWLVKMPENEIIAIIEGKDASI